MKSCDGSFKGPTAFKFFGVVAAILIAGTELFGGGKLNPSVNYAVFYNRESGHYIEVYYSFDRGALDAGAKNNGVLGEALLAVTISADEQPVINDMWRMRVEAADSTQSSEVVDMVRYGIDPGNYNLKVLFLDVNERTQIDSIAFDIEIADMSKEELTLSEIQLASNIKKANGTAEEAFTKNHLEVIPNPGSVFGDGRPIMFYYIEAYNLLTGIETDKYQTHCWITDDTGSKVEKFPVMKRTKLKKVNASVEVGTLNISSLPSGVYNFNFGISELDSEPALAKAKRIYIYNASVMRAARSREADISLALARSEFAVMDSAQLQHEFDIAKYMLSSDGEIAFLSLDNVDARRQFLFKFWKLKDPTPNTPHNEFRKSYMERYEYSNDRFRRLGREGWRTDRGRILMIYGSPDYIDRFPNQSETYPHEIWFYDNLEGGVQFVFVDASGIREYQLVHSDMTGEIRNDNWLRTRARPLR